MAEKSYIAIDLKSFYASVECMERGLNPLTTNLLVADNSRTQKTICLAVSPSLKSYGISGRARLFEAVSQVEKANAIRRYNAPDKKLEGSSYDAKELESNPSLAIDYITAPPRMGLYIEYSTRIYNVYLKYIAPEDIHVYSIDEVFIDATHYLAVNKLSAREFAQKIIKDVLKETGITATAGIGTNLYLCKIAMDIVAKKIPADEDGVRIAELDEMKYRKELWDHKPITDFWRVGRGISKRLESYAIFTMGDIARCSLDNEALLYKLFGVNAELLIDHAWGYEPCTLEDIKAYKPESNSLSVGQVLQHPYSFDMARLIVMEMVDMHSLDLVARGLVTNQIVLHIGYDIENLTDLAIKSEYKGEITTDFYGRRVPKSAHGTVNIPEFTSSTELITKAITGLYDEIVDERLLIRRINITTNHIIDEKDIPQKQGEQLDLFSDFEELEKQRDNRKKEKQLQQAIIGIKGKYGKNAILKGMNYKEGATARQRNKQIGGHKA